MSLIFISGVPSFYKILLFKELSKVTAINTVFTNRTRIKRHNDFYIDINETQSAIKNLTLISSWQAFLGIKSVDYIYYGGWDDPIYWFFLILSPKKKNRLILESSIYEYNQNGIKYFLFNLAKKLFLKRISLVVASGMPQKYLLEKLNYKNAVKYSHSVGLLDFNYPPVQKNKRLDIKNFLFIGRVSYIKGVDFLHDCFAQRNDLILHIVGEQEDYEFDKQQLNIKYHGYRSRKELKDIFEACDVLILPSRSDPWGLVIEEALYHGLPVIVSDKVGCRIDIVENYEVGLTFKLNDKEDLKAKIDSIRIPSNFNRYLENIKQIDFEKRKQQYIESFLYN